MKKVLLTIFTLLSLNCHAQTWVEYNVDSSLTVTIPDNYIVVDTLGQHMIKAQISNAFILIQRLPNTGESPVNIQSKEELTKNYEEFQKGLTNSQGGKLIDQQMLERNGLQLTHFSINATMGEEKQIRHFSIIFFNENWYSISFWEVEELTNELKSDRDKFFSSIKFPEGSSLSNQLSDKMEGSLAYKIGFIAGKMIVYPLIVGVVGLIVWIVRRRKKKKEQGVV